jgi:hypothetical protein
MKRLYINTLLVFGIFFSSAQTTDDREYKIKAAFLFNFTQFVEWPVNALPETKAPLVIGILGESPISTYLEEIISREQVNGHPLVVQQYKNVEEIKTCHILFISLADTNKLEQAITSLKGRSILTVSDRNNFIKQGGMIGFIRKDNKIEIQINPETAKEANLIISSKLLRVAEVDSLKNNN